jgi:DnaK suppressor protein
MRNLRANKGSKMAKTKAKKSAIKAKPAGKPATKVKKSAPAKKPPVKAKAIVAKPAKAKAAPVKAAKGKVAPVKAAKGKAAPPVKAAKGKAAPPVKAAKGKAAPVKAAKGSVAPAKAKAVPMKAPVAAKPVPTKGIKSVFKAIKALVTPKKADVPSGKVSVAPTKKAAITQVTEPSKAPAKGNADLTANKSKSMQAVAASSVVQKAPARALLPLIAIPIPQEVLKLKDKPAVVEASADPTPRETHQSDIFTPSEMAAFLATLTTERLSLLDKAKAAVEGGTIALDKDEMYDEVDLASATVDQNLTFRLLDRDRKLLSEIDHAIQKIETGEFGYCEGTYEPIPKRRLELRPWCRHSVKYQEHLEKLAKSGRGLVDEDAELLD